MPEVYLEPYPTSMTEIRYLKISRSRKLNRSNSRFLIALYTPVKMKFLNQLLNPTVIYIWRIMFTQSK